MAVRRDDDGKSVVSDEVRREARLGADDGGDDDALARQQLGQRLLPAPSGRAQNEHLRYERHTLTKSDRLYRAREDRARLEGVPQVA